MRQASVLLGLAVLLSLLFPVQPLLKGSGLDPVAWQLPVLDLAAAVALFAVLPAMLLFRDGQLAQRIPRWSVWVALLAVCSVLFLLLHVSWSLDLAAVHLRDLFPSTSPHTLLDGIELASRLGVLVCLVGVLTHLESPPDEDQLARQRRYEQERREPRRKRR